MSTATLKIDLDAVAENWRQLDKVSAQTVQTGAVVKANAYGLGVTPVAKRLAEAGARSFFVAHASEGAELRRALGQNVEIYVFSGHMSGDREAIGSARLTPLLNSIEQLTRHLETLPGHSFGLQLDTGMNRLGLELFDWAAIAELALRARPKLVMSHLACADEPDHPMNLKQLQMFRYMTDGINVPRSLSATGGILQGAEYHFDVTRPGIGLYGGLPFEQALPTVELQLPVVQIRDVEAGETVGYANSWTAEGPARIATLSGGYADGIHRILSGNSQVFAGDTPCPIAGRVSMDLLTIDISHLDYDPSHLTLIGPQQSIDTLAEDAQTIGYEVLTSLGARYTRDYIGTAL